jgi:hypothetical protein
VTFVTFDGLAELVRSGVPYTGPAFGLILRGNSIESLPLLEELGFFESFLVAIESSRVARR